MYKKIFLLLFSFYILFFLTGCSIWGWLYPDESENVEDLVIKGENYLKNGDVYNSWKCYDEAVQKDPKNSKARWGAACAYILYKNVDLIMIASKLLSENDPTDIITSKASSLVDTMTKVINYLYPVAAGACDNQISKNDISVNLNLMLACMIRGFLKNGNKPGTDGKYFSDDDLFVFKKGKLTYNTNCVKIEDYYQTINSIYNEVLSSLEQYPPNSIPGTSISNLIYVTHNITEDLLLIYNIMGSSFDDFSKGMFALNNAVSGISGSETVEDLKQQMQNRYNEFQNYLTGADIDTSNLNNDHLRFVGEDMLNYNSLDPNWYINFLKSPWNTHSTPPNTTYAPGKTNLYYRYLNNPNRNLYLNTINDAEFTNEFNFVTDLTNCVLKLFKDIENANLLKNLGVQ